MNEEADQKAPQAGAEQPLESPGVRLRAARESKGLSVQDAAYALHADARVLSAMEADDFEHLGAPVFVRGHLRNFARYLELDADALVSAYEALARPEVPDLVGARSEVRVGAGAGPWISVVSWIVVVILLALAGIWFYHHPLHRQPTAPSSAPVQTTAPVQTPAKSDQTITPPASGQQGDDQDAQPSAGAVATTPSETADVTPPASAGAAGAVQQSAPSAGGATRPDDVQTGPPAAASAPPVPPAAEITLDLSLSGDSWVEVYDASGERLYYDLAQQGSTVHVRGPAPLRVFLGDSQSVDVRVDGKPFDQSRFQHSDNTARFSIAAPAAPAGGN